MTSGGMSLNISSSFVVNIFIIFCLFDKPSPCKLLNIGSSLYAMFTNVLDDIEKFHFDT